MYLSTDFMVWYIFNMKSMWEELCSQQHLQERRGSCMFFITHTPYNKLKKKIKLVNSIQLTILRSILNPEFHTSNSRVLVYYIS